MDSETIEIAKTLIFQFDVLYSQLQKDCSEVKNYVVQWSALSWSSHGAANLFDEFKRAGGYSEYFNAKIHTAEMVRADLLLALSDVRILVEQKKAGLMVKNTKGYVTSGLAHQERESMLQIDLGDLGYHLKQIEARLESIKILMELLKSRVQQFNSFRMDARAVSDMMRFGNFLGELK